jgi:hypothetical protein
MKTLAVVDGGICGFQMRIHAESADTQNVVFKFANGCEQARKFGETLMAKGRVDGYAEIAAGSEGVESLKGCCAACAAPLAAFKAMQVAAGVALPRDVTIKIRVE